MDSKHVRTAGLVGIPPHLHPPTGLQVVVFSKAYVEQGVCLILRKRRRGALNKPRPKSRLGYVVDKRYRLLTCVAKLDQDIQHVVEVDFSRVVKVRPAHAKHGEKFVDVICINFAIVVDVGSL